MIELLMSVIAQEEHRKRLEAMMAQGKKKKQTPSKYEIYLHIQKLKEDTLVYKTLDSQFRCAGLDHSRCTPL